jgi:hypothetical protein
LIATVCAVEGAADFDSCGVIDLPEATDGFVDGRFDAIFDAVDAGPLLVEVALTDGDASPANALLTVSRPTLTPTQLNAFNEIRMFIAFHLFAFG